MRPILFALAALALAVPMQAGAHHPGCDDPYAVMVRTTDSGYYLVVDGDEVVAYQETNGHPGLQGAGDGTFSPECLERDALVL